MTDIVKVEHGIDSIERMGHYIAASGLFGVKNNVQAVALMLIAQSEGRHPASAAQDYHIIQGRPSLKADMMLARFQAAGGKGIYDEHWYQVATLSHLLIENGYPVDQCRILNIPRSEDEGFLEKILTEKEINTGWQIFLNCLSIYYLKKNGKGE